MNKKMTNRKYIVRCLMYGLAVSALIVIFSILQLLSPVKPTNYISIDCRPQYEKMVADGQYTLGYESSRARLESLKGTFDVMQHIPKKMSVGFPLSYNSYAVYSEDSSSEEICEDVISNAYFLASGLGVAGQPAPMSQGDVIYERLNDDNTNFFLLTTNVLLLTFVTIAVITGGLMLIRPLVCKLAKKITEDMKKSEEHLL